MRICVNSGEDACPDDELDEFTELEREEEVALLEEELLEEEDLEEDFELPRELDFLLEELLLTNEVEVFDDEIALDVSVSSVLVEEENSKREDAESKPAMTGLLVGVEQAAIKIKKTSASATHNDFKQNPFIMNPSTVFGWIVCNPSENSFFLFLWSCRILSSKGCIGSCRRRNCGTPRWVCVAFIRGHGRRRNGISIGIFDYLCLCLFDFSVRSSIKGNGQLCRRINFVLSDIGGIGGCGC